MTTTVELRPPPAPAKVVLAIAAMSAVLAIVGIATGQLLLGLVSLASAAFIASTAYVSLTAWSRLDDDGLRSHWMRATEAVRWDDMTRIEVDRQGPRGVLRTIEAVRADGAVARWAPWYPALWYAHSSVAASLDDLTAVAAAHGVEVVVLTGSASDPAQR